MRTHGEGAELALDDKVWKVPTCLYADDTVLFAESEQKLERMVNEFDKVCDRRELKVNAGKSKVMVFERKDYDKIDFGKTYSVQKPSGLDCKVKIKGEYLEEVSEFKCLGSMLCKNDSMDGEIRERVLQGRRAIGNLGS